LVPVEKVEMHQAVIIADNLEVHHQFMLQVLLKVTQVLAAAVEQTLAH
jgi:hypothetical protein